MDVAYVDTCHFELRRKDHRCHYNDWLIKFKKVIYLIGYNSYIDIQFLDFTAVFSRQDFREKGVNMMSVTDKTLDVTKQGAFLLTRQ